MNSKLKQKILKLYKNYSTVYGPYIRKSDNRAIITLSALSGEKKKKRKTHLLARFKLEVKLKRKLKKMKQ